MLVDFPDIKNCRTNELADKYYSITTAAARHDGRTYSSAVPAATGLRCLGRLPMDHGHHSWLTSFPLRSSFSTCLGDKDCTGTGCRVTEVTEPLYRCSELRLGDETGKDLMLKCTLTNLE
jgi:hypothetical protein